MGSPTAPVLPVAPTPVAPTAILVLVRTSHGHAATIIASHPVVAQAAAAVAVVLKVGAGCIPARPAVGAVPVAASASGR